VTENGKGAKVEVTQDDSDERSLAEFARKLIRRILTMRGLPWSAADQRPLEQLNRLLEETPGAAAVADWTALNGIYIALNRIDASIARGLSGQQPQDATDDAWPEQRANLAIESLRPLTAGEALRNPAPQPRQPTDDKPPGKEH
jgi:hypothetical protein